ncbi:DUF2141 domain-containing protein [Aquimarina hainanensis]|uniref:DUF2141 domain-containing protein n=1 Tax=Aquimarina hainanensis TaxID=1578017 RepID=A0ABW5N342_9FLAO|nr:DUF2141 domain-containing protein [Aquimarina sp. TRL1]QKX06052.1 DUF2141 domain-containing protein [Aquimarina sp. TRL1]
MKTVILYLTFLLMSLFSTAQEVSGITITVTTPNVTGDQGEVIYGLYDQNTFMKAAPIQAAKSNIKNGVATITFTNVPEGNYAISCFHDTNGNNRMDFEANGMPKENYGISNNNMSYGPPVWADAKFEVATENIVMEIRM